jgi:hypothetical protein
MDDLVEMIDDMLGTGGDAGDGGTLHYSDDDGTFDLTDEGDSGSSSVEWYGTESAYEATSRVLAEQHATNLEVIDNIDGVDDYEYEVVTY